MRVRIQLDKINIDYMKTKDTSLSKAINELITKVRENDEKLKKS